VTTQFYMQKILSIILFSNDGKQCQCLGNLGVTGATHIPQLKKHMTTSCSYIIRTHITPVSSIINRWINQQ